MKKTILTLSLALALTMTASAKTLVAYFSFPIDSGKEALDATSGARRDDQKRTPLPHTGKILDCRWLADETGVFESLCYNGYSRSAGSEMINSRCFLYFTKITVDFII